jgi:hypothetical protein
MCFFVDRSLVVIAGLGVDDQGNDEEMRDLESGLSTFQIVLGASMCCWCVVILYVMREHPI